MSKLFFILPSMMVGGLLFGSQLTEAQPTPPTPPTAPKAPKPPKVPKVPKAQIHIDLGDIEELVDDQIQNALEAIGDNDQIPPHVREKLKARLEKVRVKVKARIGKIGGNDLEGIKVELGQMGEEIGQEMEDFGKDMEKWSKDFEKKVEKQVEAQMKQKKLIMKGDPWKGPMIADSEDDHDLPDMVDMDDMDDPADFDDDIKGALKLDGAKKQALKSLREKSERDVRAAKQELEEASKQLQQQLENPNVSEAEVNRAIDRVTGLEGKIRKARIIAWVNARKLLDDSQRKHLEARKK